MGLVMLGSLEKGISLLEAALPQLDGGGRDIESVGLIVVLLGEANICLGRFEQVLLHMARAREYAAMMKNPISSSYACYWLGLRAFYIGDWTHARACFDESHAHARLAQYAEVPDGAAGYALLGLGLLYCAQGADERGGQYLDRALALARLGIPPRLLRPVQGCLAERDLLAGRPISALERLDPLLRTPEGREGIDSTGLLPLLAWTHIELGDAYEAQAAVQEAVSRARSERHHLALVDALRVQALLDMRYERWKKAAAALDEALSLAGPMPYPYAEAKALLVYGQLHAAQGERAEACDRFIQARAICQQLGEVPYRQRIEQALAALDEHPPILASS
jgi:tetratricopeptide (TPR) repeat protein